MTRQAFALFPLITLSLATIACDDMDMDFGGAHIESPFHYSFDAKPGERLDLETFNGSVEIRAWDQNKVDISGTKYANTAALRDAIRIDANGGGSGVTVRAVRPSEHHGNMGAKFVIRVPHDIALDRITTSNGSIRVDEINGPVHVHSSNGSINLSHIHGAVDADTSNSAIDISELTGNAVLRTNNGHIHADHVNGIVEANSSNGGITVSFDAPPRNDVHAETSNSSIEISMPANSPARVRASTSNGSIASDFDVAGKSADSKTHLEGTINGGGPLLDLETSNGSIKIVKP
jgi:DUF4097 and DUF4098 domain-containing protein YvlB